MDARRQENAAKLAESLGKFASIRLVEVADYIEHAQYKFYAFVKPEHLKDGWTRDRIVSELNARKVPCYQGSCSEVYLEKAFDNTPWLRRAAEKRCPTGRHQPDVLGASDPDR